jgi:hypothetical protein
MARLICMYCFARIEGITLSDGYVVVYGSWTKDLVADIPTTCICHDCRLAQAKQGSVRYYDLGGCQLSGKTG